MTYPSVGAPVTKTGHRLVYQGPEGQATLRKGRKSMEVLVQQAFLRFVDAAGWPRSMALISHPVPLDHGKAGAAVCGVGRDFKPNLRSAGYRGVVVNHYVFDGALHSYLVRRFHEQHLLTVTQMV